MVNLKVSAVVPVFNEEKTVGKVIVALLASELINEVISINDGSRDESLEVLRSFGNKIKLITYPKNKGKGYAMAQGIKKAKNQIIAFFDSDLDNLSSDHIETLLEPILEGKTRVILGYPLKNSKFYYFMPYLTGERAYHKEDLLLHLKRLATARLGAETFLNSLYDKEKITLIPLKGLIHLRKHEKMSFSKAIRDYLKEGVEIAQEIGRREGVLPADYERLKDLAKIETFKEFRLKLTEIKNEKIKQFLNRFILKYIGLAKRRFKDFL